MGLSSHIAGLISLLVLGGTYRRPFRQTLSTKSHEPPSTLHRVAARTFAEVELPLTYTSTPSSGLSKPSTNYHILIPYMLQKNMPRQFRQSYHKEALPKALSAPQEAGRRWADSGRTLLHLPLGPQLLLCSGICLCTHICVCLYIHI